MTQHAEIASALTPALEQSELKPTIKGGPDVLSSYRGASSGLWPADRPTPSERAAQSRMDGLNFDEKVKLSPEQSDTLRRIEGSILRGDLQAAENTLHQFKNRPDAVTPIMDVLVKDLKAAGIEANYDVSFPVTTTGAAERSGMFSLSTHKDAMDYFTGDNKTMCLYTNPDSPSWADHEVPVHPANGGWQSPDSRKIPPDLAFKEIGARAASTLLEKRIGE